MVKPGDWENEGSVGGDSTVLLYELAQRLGPGPSDLNNIEFWNYTMFYPHPEFQEVDPKQQYHAFYEYFFFPRNRKSRDANGVKIWAQ